MRAREVMTAPAVCVGPDTPLRQAAQVLVRHGFAAVPVVDGTNQLAGILGEADVLRGALAGDPPPRPPRAARRVAEAMTREVVSTTPGAEVGEVARQLLDGGFRSLPVLDRGAVVGVVSRRDLLRAIARDDALIDADVRHRLAALPGALRDWRIEVADGVVTMHEAAAGTRGRCVAEALVRETPGVELVRVRREQR